MAPYLGMFERASYFQWCICEPTWALKWDWSLIRQELPLEGVFQSGVFEAGREDPSDLGNLVELAKELVEHEHQLLWGAFTCQPREAHDVSIQHAGQGRPHQWGQGLSPHSLPSSHPFLSIPDSLMPLYIKAVEVVGALWP